MRGSYFLFFILALMYALAGCAGFGEVTPGVIINVSELVIQRKSDGYSASYGNDLSEVEGTLSLLSSDIILDDGPILTLGMNFVYQAPTRFRSKQVEPDSNVRVSGTYTYAAVNFYEEFKDKSLSWIAERIVMGFGYGLFEIEGEADFFPGPPTTPIDSGPLKAIVYYLGLETRRFVGVENLFFRWAMGVHSADDNDYEYSLAGINFTLGYLFGNQPSPDDTSIQSHSP